MKKDLKDQKKSLRVSGETIRELGSLDLPLVVGGSTTNNGCTVGSTSHAVSICTICQF